MNRGLIAARYATALFGFTTDKGVSKTVYAEMKNFLTISLAVPKFLNTLSNPAFTSVEKKKIIYAAFGQAICTETEQFVTFLISKNREDFLIPVALKFTDIYRKTNNIHVAKLCTVSNPNPQTETRLVKMIEAKTGGTVEFEKEIDETIIGGFIIEVDNLRWDASVARRLKEMRDKYSIR